MKTLNLMLIFCGLFESVTVCATNQQTIGQQPILLSEMSDAERAFVEKQNARKAEMMKRYFSPEARAKLKAEIEQKNGPASAAQATSAMPDSSVANAKASGVDTRVFGLPLDEPLRLPACATANERKNETRSNDPYNALKNVDIFGAFRGVQTSTTCKSEGSIMAFMGMMVGGTPADRYIMLAKDSCPDWAYCEVASSLHEGKLVGVTVLVQKSASDDYVAKQLRAKYGNPTGKETAIYQNQYGARYEVDELEWALNGLHVQFVPGANGGGVVLIETETGRRDREAKAAAEDAKQPKL